MRFEQALQAMREGKQTRRSQYDNSFFYLENRYIMYKRKGDSEGIALSGLGSMDITAEDWEIVEDD